MHQGLNRVTLIGQLAGDPETRRAPSGVVVAPVLALVTAVTPPEFPAVWPRPSSPLLQASATNKGVTRRTAGLRRNIMGDSSPAHY